MSKHGVITRHTLRKSMFSIANPTLDVTLKVVTAERILYRNITMEIVYNINVRCRPYEVVLHGLKTR